MPRKEMHPAAMLVLRTATRVVAKAVGRAVDSVLEDVDEAAEEVVTRVKRARGRIRDVEESVERRRR